MPEFTSYPAGTPSWVDHAAKDLAASNSFYSNLFNVQGKIPQLATRHDYYLALALTVRDQAFGDYRTGAKAE